jgi:hypothetical protein
VTDVDLSYDGTPPLMILCRLIRGGQSYYIFEQRRPVSGQYYGKQGWWILEAADCMQMVIYGATAGDGATFFVTGFKVQLAA